MQRRHAHPFVLALSCLLLGIVETTATPARSDGGRLLIAGEEPQPAPTLSTEISVQITGPVARTRVVQRFINPGDDWIEAIYEVPLPEHAAVDGLYMVVGHRVLEGQIRERAEARREYQEAAQEGKRASLVEQRRPDLFTTSLANIGPHEEIEIEIEYQQTLDYADGRFSLRLPLTVAPRFDERPPPSATAEGIGSFWARRFRGRERAVPAHRAVAPVRIDIDLDAGVDLREVVSGSHAIHVTRGTGHRHRVQLADDAPADRDFTLEWEPETGSAPIPALWIEPHGEHYYGLLMVLPPRSPDAGHRLDREVVFVIDTSGSMNGPSIEQARRALLWALDRLEPSDRFNVIGFASVPRALFPAPVSADAANRARAREWVADLAAGGGTNMAPALAEAMIDERAAVDVRQIVFITDGAVGNDAELFEVIQSQLGRSRLFTVGIGSAPNGHFMRKAAQCGRGTVTFIHGADEVETRMSALFARLERPVLSDLELHWSDPEVEAWPRPLPDLYWGEPLVVAARLSDLDGRLDVDGWQGDVPWNFGLELIPDAFAGGVHQLWAHRKVASLQDRVREGADAAAIREEIVALGLQHGLVTRHTSLVAIDVTPSAPAGGAAASHRMPSPLPAGWNGERLPQTATMAPLLRGIALALLAAAAGLHWATRRVHPRHGASGGGGRP